MTSLGVDTIWSWILLLISLEQDPTHAHVIPISRRQFTCLVVIEQLSVQARDFRTLVTSKRSVARCEKLFPAIFTIRPPPCPTGCKTMTVP